jgi:tetratricopeptide (TPR) repeat protein
MFMAASPLGETELDFDIEELAILRATERAGLDLAVEDSGNLAELRVAWEDGSFEVLHLSCHGLGGRQPFLALEADDGATAKTDLATLATAFAARPPRLLFLSACHTGESDADADSLALGLVGVGLPAVMAWAAAVNDRDASLFAAAFYHQAAHRSTTLQAAWALARAELLRPAPGREPPEHWHLARLFLGSQGGGRLASGRAPRLRAHPDAGRKDIVEARGGRIEVASRWEFVGRRREIQTIRREFRHPEHAGVVIHGFGRQGKSSLAARIIDRHPELTRVALYQRVDGASVLAAIRAQIGEAADICDRWHERVDPQRPEYDPDALYHALRALFDVPCGYVGSGKPFLLVLDDFEALLDPPDSGGHWRVKPDAAAAFAAIIRAFDDGGTNSRLLITSRYLFRLGIREPDPALRLLSVQLAETSAANRLKQARQKLLATGRSDGLPPLTADAIGAARGNAGLQDLLFQAVLADPAAGEAAIAALEEYLGGGALPERQDLRDTLEKLVIGKLLDALSDGERRLLRLSTAFQLPLLLPVWEKYAAAAGLGHPDRLLAFGLWEKFPDIADPHRDAAGPNAIAATRLPPLEDPEAKTAIAAMLPDLFAAWGGPDRSRAPYAADIELTRLALACGNLDVLAATAVYAIRGLEQSLAYREAAATAAAILDALDAGGRILEIELRHAAAEIFDRVGDAERLDRVFGHAGELVEDDPSLSAAARAARAGLRLRYASYLNRRGDPDRALGELQAASAVYEALGDRGARAVALGDIARIMTDRGEVDRALALHQERLKVNEALGDRRERVTVLNDIARILRNKGEIDRALALYQEQLQVFEALGDRRERTIVLGDIARIMADQGEVDEALALHQEQLEVYEVLGDRRERAVVLGDIARIITAKGEVDAALALHEERLKVYEALGDRRSRAIALGDIAEILKAKGEIDQALALHREELQVYETLGDRRSRAVTLGEIARILGDKGEVDQALALHQEQQQIFEALGDRRARAVTLGDIARIMTTKGEVDAALALHQERLTVYEALGDRRSRAVTLGDIAWIMTDKGEVDKALALQKERLAVNRELGDQNEIATASYDIGQIYLSQSLQNQDGKTFQLAFEALAESYRIFSAIGRVEGIAMVGATLGGVLAIAGARDEARQILQRSLDGFRKLGRPQQAAQVEQLLQRLA